MMGMKWAQYTLILVSQRTGSSLVHMFSERCTETGEDPKANKLDDKRVEKQTV